MKLVFLHGAGNSGLSFYYQLRHFRNSKAIELPGHPTGKACTTIDGYLEWVRGFNAARRYKDVVLCGHSMGGAIALLYALRYPGELKGLILIGTGARIRGHPDYLQRAQEPGEGNANWLERKKEQFKGVDADIYQMLVRRASELGPEVAVEVALLKDIVTLTIDTSGQGLHKRGYRDLIGTASLRETLAAALVQLSFWNGERPLVDPFCGSGTICMVGGRRFNTLSLKN